MQMRFRSWFIVGMVCALAGAPRMAHAQTPEPAPSDRAAARAQAREIGGRAFTAFDRGDWRQAETLFRRADSVYHASSLLLGLARSEAQLGELVEATEHYQRIIDEGPTAGGDPAVMMKAVESAKREIGGVKARCARVILRVVGAPARPLVANLDETRLPGDAIGAERLVNPGPHHFTVRAEGEVGAAETTVTLAEGESREVVLTLGRDAPETSSSPSPSPLEPPSPIASERGTSSTQRTLGFVALGVGGAALVTGTVTGILALGAKSSLSGHPCATGAVGCNQSALDSYQSDLSRYHATTAIATVGFTLAVAGGIAGAVLLLTAPQQDTPRARAMNLPKVLPYAGPDGIGATGRF